MSDLGLAAVFAVFIWWFSTGIVLLLDSIDEREMLLEVDPKLYFITDHYKNYAYVLARLEAIDEPLLRAHLTRIWKKIAPRKLVKELGANL